MKIFRMAAAAASISYAAGAAAEAPGDFQDRLSAFLGSDFPISAVTETPVSGIFEVTAGNRVLYVGMQDEFVFIGNMFDMARNVNVGEQKQNEVTQRLAEEEIGGISVDDMVVFEAKERKRHITVFTDVECGYCRRLHKEVPQLNDAGIEVRYLMFPVLTQKSLPNAISVWCADDQQTAMTEAKLGKSIERVDCVNPVNEQLAIGRKLGVRGTPFLVLDDYTVIPGYVPAKELIARMGL